MGVISHNGKVVITPNGKALIPPAGGVERVTWQQCPEAVRNYLANVTYNPADYSTSQIDTYAPATAVASNTKPIGKTVDGVTYYNEEPNVDTPFSSTNTAGTLKPLDQLRWINNVCIENFRDIGGWSCDGGKVKYGKIFRGSRLVSTDATGISQLLTQLHLGAELDLRYDSDIHDAPETLKDYVDYLHIDGNWYSLTDKTKWRGHLRFIFDCVQHNKPVLFHCAGGLDRTGTLACILEAILGVSQSEIDKDYELGCFYSGTSTAAVARRRNEDEWKGLINAINANTGSTFRDKAINFVASLGFTATEINAFRSAMIDGTPETVSPSYTSRAITKNLTLADIDNTSSTINNGAEYKAIITPQDGTKLKSASVTMNGSDISDTALKIIISGGIDVNKPIKGEINIPFVSGNIVINGLAETNARLPSEYQEVEWIGAHVSTTYTASINPNLKWSEFDKVEFDGYRDDYDGYSGSNGLMLLSTYTSEEARTTPYVAFRDSKGGIYFTGVTGTIDNNYTQSQLRDGTFKPFTLTFTEHSSTAQCSFGSWSDAGFFANWRTKEQRWFNGSTMIRQFVPCYRKSDGVIGMYDLVGDTFYTNAGGSGNYFVKGNNI